MNKKLMITASALLFLPLFSFSVELTVSKMQQINAIVKNGNETVASAQNMKAAAQWRARNNCRVSISDTNFIAKLLVARKIHREAYHNCKNSESHYKELMKNIFSDSIEFAYAESLTDFFTCYKLFEIFDDGEDLYF